MKKLIAVIVAALLCIFAIGCGAVTSGTATGRGAATNTDGGTGDAHNPGNGRTLISRMVVDPTCLTEGYTEYEYSDGYVCRDTFVPKTDHLFMEYTLGTDIEGLTRTVCRYCGMERVSYNKEDISTDVVIDENRPRPSFTREDVMICSMIIEQTPDNAIRAMRTAERTGARGFMIYVSCLSPEYRTFEHIRRIMQCTELPVMALAYSVSYFQSQSLSYDEMAALLRLSVQAGAAAIDFQGYMWADTDIATAQRQYKSYWEAKGFDMSFVSSSPKEVSTDPAVLAKQAQFINEIHALGAEVLLSIHAGVQLSAKQIVALGKFVEAQNVDIVKMVLGGSSKQTVIEHLTACMTLSNELDIKFSVHGQSTLSRLMCPMFGSYIAFCVDEYTQVQTNIQIELKTMADLFRKGELNTDLETLVNLFDSPEMRGSY